MAKTTKAQAAVMEAAERFGFIAQSRCGTFACSSDLAPGFDGRVQGAGHFNWSTVNALCESGRLVWVQRRCGRAGRWVAALARVNG